MSAPAVGSKILHYTLVRSIGSGGMGVVYEAEDAKLGRRVALKFLPPSVAGDRPSLERFQREARAASALNHPNICTIYAIEESGSDCFIAMELLDGDALDRQIASRQLAWDAVVEIGIQVADALAAAHRRGIVHRDIKPANIFLTREGRAKVLDFGVAKMGAHDQSEAATMTMAAAEKLTGPGLTVGTIAYMSPEQARGDDLDARSDLFSLAAVLYEMSTRRPAFDGRTSAVVFKKILDETPDAPIVLNPALPPRLDEIIVKGLEKDRDLRYQTADELRGDLKRLKRDASAGKLILTPATGTTGVSRSSSGAILAAEARRLKGPLAVFAITTLALLAAAAYGIYAMFLRPPPPAPAAVSSRMKIVPLTTSGDIRGCGSISPDGKYVAYCNNAGQISLQQVATGSTVRLVEAVGATTFSPDSNFVYVSITDEKYPEGVLLAIPTIGGEPRRVVSGVDGPVGVSPDGLRIAFLRSDDARRTQVILTADAFGGNERELAVNNTGQETWFQNVGVAWSPDGKRLSATQATIIGGYRLRPVVIDATTGRVELLDDVTWANVGRTAWLPGSNALLFAAQEGLAGSSQFWIAHVPGGRATRVTSDARGFGDISVSVTADGSTIATVYTEDVSNVWSTNADATAPFERWTSGRQKDGTSGIAPQADGRVYYTSGDGAEMTIWVVDAAGAPPRWITRQYSEVPATPDDGRFVVFNGIHENHFRIWRIQPDGTDARVLTRGQDDINPRVSPDGRWIYYMAAGAVDRLVRIPSDGGEPTPIGEPGTQIASISADGRELLVQLHSGSGDRVSHAVLDAETGAVKARLSLPVGAFAGFGRRPDLVTFALMKNGASNLWEQPRAGGPARQLTKFTTEGVFGFAYTPDRTRLFVARGNRTGNMVLIRDFR